MAMLSGATTIVPKLHIEALQSVMPLKMTEPRQTCRVSATDPFRSGIFRRHLHIVLYYKKVTQEDSGWLVAGWIKESLAIALSEQPMFGGRLRRAQDGDGKLEIVSNDGGVRLVEAQIPITLLEFLDLKEREEDVEAELVFWKDIDEQNPHFSSLFCVQVTNFQCGGYTIGLSCSLLLADPLVMTSFLKRWSNIHNNMLSKTDMPKLPLFYLPNLKRTSDSLNIPSSSTPSKDRGQTTIFKIVAESANLEDKMHKTLALLCVEKVGRQLGSNTPSEFSLFVKERSGDMNVEICSKQGLVNPSPLSFKSEPITSTNWNDLGADEVSFCEGNKPTCVSHWIEPVFEEGIVMVIPAEGISGMNVIVTTPIE